ncbi:MAG: acyl-CoA dehydrogenase family protein [Pseudomonadales bacterium]|jgi:alkylation response protein AidB-like acyl-CoA dehydrogenase|nr:acyl-CoA dehydrogenase family protein [Pseudomonadales bacterium]MDP6470981.1 acyl-CoA dehydrogenase family protein [Pseudomonadales bacterium]MDP6825834.1 acyl-CoA dehydrogenase family protein [Pseudomonadales bacterium]MDP6970173.1 acyl-CoA dehydrogenase family protein [Pseudomonadales bacterium]
MSLDTFREETRDWLESNVPQSMRNRTLHFEDAYETYNTDEAHEWRDRAAGRGWIAPTWDTKYGGGGLDRQQDQVLAQEMAAIKALPPATGMGLALIGPTLLEFGTEDQKMRHLPAITSDQVVWCQGYSEPGAGSDLASLRTRAELQGDHFVINGQKIWTSGGDRADWMFCLVRTDPSAPKHDGISFVLLPMDQEGVTVKPIALISGSSPFCETFFDNALARKDDLIGEMNKGWTVAKRLLQYERSGAARSAGPAPKRKQKPMLNAYAQLAKDYLGESNGKIADAPMRATILDHVMQERALGLTATRTVEESKSSGAPGAATSIFKYVGSTLAKNSAELKSQIRGTSGLAWEGVGFSEDELDSTRDWLRDRAVTIYGGTNEVQLNIIAKRVLGLPD